MPWKFYETVGYMCVVRELHPKHVLREREKHMPLLREIAEELRRMGASYPEIAHCLGYKSNNSVYELLQRERSRCSTLAAVSDGGGADPGRHCR